MERFQNGIQPRPRPGKGLRPNRTLVSVPELRVRKRHKDSGAQVSILQEWGFVLTFRDKERLELD